MPSAYLVVFFLLFKPQPNLRARESGRAGGGLGFDDDASVIYTQHKLANWMA